jgi:hypothetical protein
MTGTVEPRAGENPATLQWDGASQPYEAAGGAPAIAVDPTTGNGVEVHEAPSHDGTLVRRAFRVKS